MKTLHHFNIIFLSIILLIGLYTLFNNDAIFILLTSVFFLGLFQAITGIILFLKAPKDISRQLYIGGLSVFGILCYAEMFWMLPPIPLALYFSYMIYIKKPTT